MERVLAMDVAGWATSSLNALMLIGVEKVALMVKFLKEGKCNKLPNLNLRVVKVNVTTNSMHFMLGKIWMKLLTWSWVCEGSLTLMFMHCSIRVPTCHLLLLILL